MLERLEDRWLPTGTFIEDFSNDLNPALPGVAASVFHHSNIEDGDISALNGAHSPPHAFMSFGLNEVTFDLEPGEFVNSAAVWVNYRFGGLQVEFIGTQGSVHYHSPNAGPGAPGSIQLPDERIWHVTTATRAVIGDITAIRLVGGEGLFDDVTIEVQSDQQGPQTVSWAVDANGFWDDPANWSTGRVPRTEDDVVINRPAGSFTVTVRQDTAAAHSLIANENVVLAGGTLAVATTIGGFGTLHLSGGTMNGGLTIAGNTLQATSAGGTLIGVTINGHFDLTPIDARAIVTDGLVLNGTARLGGFGASLLGFQGRQTLAGSGEIVFGTNRFNAIYPSQAGTTLTIGPGIRLRGQAGEVGVSTRANSPSDVTVINTGVIRADTPGEGIRINAPGFVNRGTVGASGGGVLDIESLTGNLGPVTVAGGARFAVGGDFVIDQMLNVTEVSTLDLRGAWRNTGTLRVDRSTVNLGGTFTLATLGRFEKTAALISITGLLENELTTVAVDAVNRWQLAGGIIRGGTVAIVAGERFHLTPQGGTLDGVTIEGEVEALHDARVRVTGGLTLNGLARLNGGRWEFAGTQTLAGSGQVILGEHPSNALRLTDPGTTLVIGQRITVRGAAGSIGFSPIWGGPADVTVENEGTIVAEGRGHLIRGNIHLRPSGLVRVTDGATFVDQNAHHGVVNSGIVNILAGGTFATKGDLLVDTANADRYTPLGTTLLDGVGTAAAPQRLEVLSRDQGASPEAFRDGFVHGALRLGGQAYVRFVDQADNTAGTGAEALYVNSLIVPAGATLDLNGLRVYTRAALIQGTVLGDITLVPDSGTLFFARPTPGHLAAPGEFDEWTFFGRADQRVVIVVSLADASWTPAGPILERAEVRLMGPDGSLLATASSPASARSVVMPEAVLPAQGNYRIQVRSPGEFADRTGHYLITLWDARRDVAPLRLNERLNGWIETPFSEDRWQFAATAGQSVRLALVGSSFAGLAFRLTGPGGAVLFDDLSGDSDLITLPASGAYALTASGRGGTTGNYAFRFGNSTVIELPVNTTYNGVLLAAEQDLLFHVRLDHPTPLLVFLDDFSNENRSEVYVKRGQVPTATDYDYRSATALTAEPQTLVPMASPGDWYVLVHGALVARASTPFTLRAETAAVLLTGVTPGQLGNNADGLLTLNGAGLAEVVAVRAVAADGTAYPAVIDSQSPTQLTARLAAGAVPAGSYAVRVTTRSGETVRRDQAFVMNAGGVPHLEARLVVPQTHGPSLGQSYVEYRNTGTAAMPAPLLTVRILTPGWVPVLDWRRVGEASWSSALPDGISDTLQILAVGATPGLLQPGESFLVPYSVVRVADGLVNLRVDQQLTVTTTSNTEVVEWDALRESVRPPHVDPAAWAPIWTNFAAQAGRTWGDYVRMLDDNAAYLQRLGQRVIDVGQLFTFEMLQAQGLHSVRTIASSMDASVEAPGLALALGRSYANTIPSRYQRGSFGRGWFHSWESTLNVESDGAVFLTVPGGSERRFHPDRRSAGYFSQPGDFATLTHNPDGSFDLREKDGLLRRFRPDGKIDFLQDVNGNRVAAAYTSGRLTRLTHSSGQFLAIAYNAAGLIDTVTDSEGETTRYTYDTANEYLLSAQLSDGRTVHYTYSTGAGAAREHALTSIQAPSGVTRHFEYDAAGRLASTFLTGNAERVDFSFDSAGTVTAHTWAGSSRAFFDGRGTIVQAEDVLGHDLRFAFDDQFNLTRVTDAAGLTLDIGYDSRGNVTRMTDQLGHVTRFSYGQPVPGIGTDRLVALTDANGKTTRFDYDSRGNRTATTYPNQTVEQVVFDALGDVETFTNRRGRPVSFTRNAAGQVTRKTYADGSAIDATYDARGNLATLTDPDGVIRFEHDLGDRLTRVDYPNGRFLQYSYDTAGRRDRMVDQDSFAVNYAYDRAGRLDGLTDDAGDLIVAYTYDGAGRMVRKDLGGGGFATYEYNAADQLLHLVNHGPDGSVHTHFDYAYDVLGRRISMSTLDGTWTYAYDGVGQLTHAVFTSINSAIPNQNLRYEYDAVGNRVRTVINGVSTDYVTNSLNQHVQVGDARYDYDADGNLVAITNPAGTVTFTYDDDSRLTGAAITGGAWSYDYDALGNRDAVTHNGQRTDYLIDPTGLGDVVGEYSAGSVARYAHGFGLVGQFATAGRYYYEFDGLGNVVGMTAPGGSVANRYAYAPFGERLMAQEAVANPFQFVGEFGVMHEANGLEFMRARYYSPAEGRFTSQDPIGFSGLDINLYRYVANDPASAVDPAGTFAFVVPLLYVAGAGLVAALIVNHVQQHGQQMSEDLSNAGAAVSAALATIEEALQAVIDALGELERQTALENMRQRANRNRPGRHPDQPAPPFGPGNGGQNGNGGGSGGGGNSGGQSNPGFIPPNPDPDDDQPGGQGSSRIVRASDPNQKSGAAGFGPQAFVTSDSLFPYRIDFENEPTATAAAQQVDVTDQLDGDLDWTTFELVSVGFGDVIVAAPPGSWWFRTTVLSSNNGRDFVVEIDVRLDPATGRLVAHFTSLDPLTGLPPDVLTGFLPPEDGTGRGQGHIAYIIRPRPGLATGTEIRNIAEIRFDASETVATNQVAPHDPAQGTDPAKEALNTIDAAGPTSRVNPLPLITNTADFAVSWAGSDDAGGSGVASYDVYVSVDGGAFQPFLLGTTLTTAVFHGTSRHTYGFYSVATDNVGHRQPTAAGAQAITRVNLPPIAAAGGPYAISEGGVLALSAAGSSDPDNDPLTYSWDVNGDGVFGDVAGFEPTVTWAQLATLGIADGPRANAVRVRISDATTASESPPTLLTVGNAPPAAGLAGPASGMRGVALSFTLTATDPSAPDQAGGFTFRIDWGDGTPLETVTGPSGTAATHTYDAAGNYTVRVTAEDKDGGESSAVTLPVSVIGQLTSIVTVASSANPALVGQAVTFTATVAAAGAPTGSVQFQVDGANIGAPQPLAGGVARFTIAALAPGNHVVKAVYGGDGSFLPGIGQVTQAVRYSFGGFRPPLRPGDTYNLGRDLPIKFLLTDFAGNSITALSAVRSLRIQRLDESGNTLGLPFDPVSVDGLGLRVTDGQFQFNWKTTGLTAGRYRIVLELGDDTTWTLDLRLA